MRVVFLSIIDILAFFGEDREKRSRGKAAKKVA
jgi:hypothetical protein